MWRRKGARGSRIEFVAPFSLVLRETERAIQRENGFGSVSEIVGEGCGLRESNGEGSFMEDKESQREREDIEAVVGRTHVSAMDKIKRLRYLHYMLVPEKLHHPFIEILFFFFF
jgi:hypothetical protein